MDFRVGIGLDVHRWAEGRPLFLAGIQIPFERGLLGHSDADALLHAVTDAILGALAAGDIGTHFPDNDPKWKDCPSSVFVSHAADMVQERGWQISNVDTMIMAEHPKLKPHMASMRASLAGLLKIDIDRVGIKAGTMEKMGFVGREEGVIVQAVVSLIKD